MLSLFVPLLILAVLVYALYKKVNIFSAMTDGAMEGLKTTVKILPPLVALMSIVELVRVCGVSELISDFLYPVFTFLSIPSEVSSLVLIRPLSGSAALAVGSDIINKYGADSLIGRTAAVMLSSTETTFYTVAVYFGAAGIKKTRFAIPAALCADLAGFIVACLVVRLFYG
jgi:spore maturation protein B